MEGREGEGHVAPLNVMMATVLFRATICVFFFRFHFLVGTGGEGNNVLYERE